MNSQAVGRPFEAYLSQGISASEAIDLLQKHDGLMFPQLRSGLFPAANFDNLAQDETGMSNAWLRDSACVGLILLRTNQHESAIQAAQAVLSRLHAIRQSFDSVIASGHAPEQDSVRPPVRFSGQDSEPRYDWANAQNDAIGYSLQLIGASAQRDVDLQPQDIELIDTLVLYLDTIEYWQDEDSGHWEELKKVNASSIGIVVGGLRAIQSLASDSTKVVALIEKGQDALKELLPFESKTPGRERKQDASLLFLVEPQHILQDEVAEQIIQQTVQNLVGEYGVRRYQSDSYWGPDYREHFQLGNRTADFSRPEAMAERDGFLKPGYEAQWTLFDPLISAYYAHKHQKSGNDDDAKQAGRYMTRALLNVVTHQKEGKEVWRVPELFFLEKGNWVPNDHLGLLWSQANLWYGLKVYQEVLGDSNICYDENHDEKSTRLL